MMRQRWMMAASCCFLLGIAVGWAMHEVPVATAVAQSGKPMGKSTGAQPVAARQSAPPVDHGKLRIICFGAHPDDCELQAGGTAALWAEAGHHVSLSR